MKLRPYQQQALEAAWGYLRTSDGNPALVLPTGAGKSPLMAALASEAVQNWQGRVAVLAHVRELVEQNAAKMQALAPGLDVGLYSAGLGRRDTGAAVTFAQIQSVAKRAAELGPLDLVLVDEAHRIPLQGDGMYLRFIESARALSPHLRVVGLTATPYRMQGRPVPVCGPGCVLSEIAYEARIPDLIRDGYLSPLRSRAPERPDLAGVHTARGEYVEAELAAVMEDDERVRRTVADLLARTEGRRAGIVFCVRGEHARKVLAELRERGETAALVTAETPSAERTSVIAQFQRGALRWLVNINVLSEGFDAPHIDVVAMLRPTKSPGLYYQQVGRGLRLAEGKTDCLVLDYAGNVVEHGPVDEIRVERPRPGKPAQLRKGQFKECPACGELLALGVRACPCGQTFGGGLEHLTRPTGLAVVSSERERIVNWVQVSGVKYSRHEKPGRPASMKVTYQCGLRRFNEWVCLEHGGMAGARALRWWQERDDGPAPRSVNEAIDRAWNLPRPEEIQVDETDKYAAVVGYRFGARTERDNDNVPAWLRGVA